MLSWRNSIKLYRCLSVCVRPVVIGSSAACNTKLPGSQRGAAPPHTVKSIRNGFGGMAASWLTAQLQVFSSEKPAEVLPVHITLLLDVGSMLTFAQRFERPGTSPLPVTLAYFRLCFLNSFSEVLAILYSFPPLTACVSSGHILSCPTASFQSEEPGRDAQTHLMYCFTRGCLKLTRRKWSKATLICNINLVVSSQDVRTNSDYCKQRPGRGGLIIASNLTQHHCQHLC